MEAQAEQGVVQAEHLGVQDFGVQSTAKGEKPKAGSKEHTVHSRAAQEFVGVKRMRTWEGVQA